MRFLVLGLVCTQPDKISQLLFMEGIKTATGFDYATEIENGAQEFKILGGSQSVSNKLLEHLRKFEEFAIHFSHIVTKITQNDDFVEVFCENGKKFKSKYIVLSIPFNLYKKIDFKMPVIFEKAKSGIVIKIHIYYKKPYWREKGLSGQSFCDDSPILASIDDSPPDNSYFGLMGFIFDSHCLEWRKKTLQEKQDFAALHFAKIFDMEELKNPIYYDEMDWQEEKYSEGGYSGFLPPGEIWKNGEGLKSPYGRIYFAGGEFAHSFNGYMDGAISSGKEASQLILNKLDTK